ncbi:MAG TPA: ATP-binding protein [Candidatus Paceibacterota bacterium]|nr:ATP-binding protein [Candidatus Paceibacterota bacterium]
MPTDPQALIELCQWDTARYFIFSENVFSHLIYYSHLLPLVASLILGIFIISSNKTSAAAKALFFSIIGLNIWLFFDLILWATEIPRYTMFFWSIINMVEPMIYAGILFFLYFFIRGKSPSFWPSLGLGILLIPTIVLTPTHYALEAFNLTNCDREAVEGIMVYYGYFVEILITIWILVFGFASLIREKVAEERRKIGLVVFGSVFLLLSFALGNVIGSLFVDWTIGQYGLLGIPVFVGLLGYLIVRFHAFNIRLIAAQALVAGVWILVLGLLFIRTIEVARIVTAITLIFVIILGIALVRGVKREIEQRERLEVLTKELQSANDRLKELDQLKSEFLSIASHQLRAPITAIRGYAANIADGTYGPVPDHLKEPLETVQETTRLMVNSIEDYLNISRIEQGRMKYEKSDFDIADLAKKVVNELTPVAAKKQLTLSVNAPEDLMVNADIGKIKQVITNLVDNAIKYTKEGGITVAVAEEQNKVRVTVTDTGVGIPAEEINGLFEKFKRARGANNVNTTGTGLGLYVAKQLAEGHGGSVRATSDGAGKGSCFILELPR